MEWQDEAFVLSATPHGETGLIVQTLTRHHGRCAGLARTRRDRSTVQPGARVQARWRARLESHLGSYTLEPLSGIAGAVIDDPLRLAALASATALMAAGLPERQPTAGAFEGFEALLAALPGPVWDAVYIRWEVGLLGLLGFGLDLARCAATGRDAASLTGQPRGDLAVNDQTATDHTAGDHTAGDHTAGDSITNDRLAYVSPRTGRAVSLSAGEPYHDRLLRLPGFLIGEGAAAPADILDGFALTGHFLARQVFGQAHMALPVAREILVDRYRRTADRLSG